MNICECCEDGNSVRRSIIVDYPKKYALLCDVCAASMKWHRLHYKKYSKVPTLVRTVDDNGELLFIDIEIAPPPTSGIITVVAHKRYKNGRITYNTAYYASPDYNTLHKWVLRHYEKTGSCEKCGDAGKTQWSNISGNYNKDRSDWQELCVSCHTLYDKNMRKSGIYARKSIDIHKRSTYTRG